jgi:hypothetical protein
MLRLRVFWPPRLTPYLPLDATIGKYSSRIAPADAMVIYFGVKK